MTSELRVLTVRQPWADLIMAGVKDVENRTWPVPSTLQFCDTCGTGYPEHDCGLDVSSWTTPCDGSHVLYPFTLGIHAAQAPASMTTCSSVARMLSNSQSDAIRTLLPGDPWERLGVLLGTVTVTGCHHADECLRWHGWGDGRFCSPWAVAGVYHWTLTDPQPYDEPFPMRGQQRLWTAEAVSADV